MKIGVIYSSKTGNTKKVADAISAELPADTAIHHVSEKPNPDQFDFIFMGYWVDKGTADQEAINYMQTVSGKKVAQFVTLGAYPDSDHARQSLAKGAACFGEDCEVIDNYICQGAIDPKLIEWMKQLGPDHPHAPDEARIKRWKDASTRPNQDDLKKAGEFARGIYKSLTN